MLISDSHEFIFLRMRKVASTSIKGILRPLCINTPGGKLAHFKSRARLEWNYQKYVFRAHDDIQSVQKRMPAEKFARYFKFTFVRNPWERLVSEYEFLLNKPEHHRHSRVKGLRNFSEFIRMQIPRSDAYQINMMCDRQGRLLLDFVGKLETLQNDWETVCEQIDVTHQPLPHKNVTQRSHFQDYYNSENRQLVGKHWAREIDLFNYSFVDHS